MIRRGRFVFGAEDWTTAYSVKPWLPVDESVGGSRTSAAGIPAAYVVRRDALLELTLRLTEAEWADCLALIAFGQSKQTFLFYPEAAENDPVEVWLESPAPGERYSPARLGGFERFLEAALVLRGVNAAPWQAYFTDS